MAFTGLRLPMACMPLLRVWGMLSMHRQTASSALQVAFEGVGSMPMERINSYRARKQREVDREMAARETRVRCSAGLPCAVRLLSRHVHVIEK